MAKTFEQEYGLYFPDKPSGDKMIASKFVEMLQQFTIWGIPRATQKRIMEILYEEGFFV